MCPRIETQFRYGDIPYQAWVDAGLKPAISNDDPGTYAIDMFREMQTLYGYQRSQILKAMLAGSGNAPKLATLRDMLEAATIRGAQNCGLGHKVGSLTPGKQADIVLIDTNDIHTYPKHSAWCTAVQCAGVGNVDTVLIDGRVAKWRGKLVGVNFDRLKRAVAASRDYLFQATGWAKGIVDVS